MQSHLAKLVYARHFSGTRISIRFADNWTATADLAETGLNFDGFDFATVKLSEWGDAVEILDSSGEVVDIDSAVLRAIVDPPFAKEIERLCAS